MSFDELGFLKNGTVRLLWLPYTLRGPTDTYASLIAIGGSNGAVTFVQWSGH